MAEEQDNYKINFDTNAKKAAQDTNELAKGLDNVDDSTQKVVNSNKSLKAQMKEATVELIQAQQKFGDYSKEALSAAKNLAQLRDKIAEASETANLFDPGKKFQAVAGAVSAMASGFAVAQGAMGLFGVQSEEVEKTLLKVQSAMALSQGLSTIADSAKDFQRLKAVVVDAMRSIATAKAVDTVATESNTVAQGANAVAVTADTTVKSGATIATTALTVATNILNASMAVLTAPIFLVIGAIAGLVVGIGYLTGAFGDFSGEAAAAENANKKLNSEIDVLSKKAEKANKEMERSNGYLLANAKASGASGAELRKLAEQLINNEVAEKRLNAVKAQSIFLEARRVASLEDATDAQKATAQKAYELFKEQNGIYNQSLEDRKQLALNHRVQIRQEETDAENKLAEDRKKANEKRLEEQKKANEKRLEEEKKQREKEAALLKEGLDYENNLKKQIEDLNDETEEEKLNRQRSRAEQEIEALKQKGINVEEITRLNAEKFDELEAELAEKRNEEDLSRQAEKGLFEIELAKANADRQIEIDHALVEQKKAIEEDKINILEKGLALLGNIFGKSKAIQKGVLIAESAVSIGKQVMANNAANIAALATPQAVASSGAAAAPVIALNNITTALGIASTIAATSKALSALGGGGGSAGGSNMGGGGGGAVSATPPTVAFNNTAENQIGQSVARTQAEQPPLKVSVLESDITRAQNNVVKLTENNTI